MAEKLKNINDNVIVVDDGSVIVSIKNTLGAEIGQFCFRPTDIDIINRYNEIAASFDEIIAPLENVGLNPDGTPSTDDEADIEIFNSVKAILCEKVDYLFGGNASEAFFKQMHPFSIIRGSFYCENMIEAVGKYISAAFDRETKHINKRVNRYTQQYQHGVRTGKHKNGGKRGNK